VSGYVVQYVPLSGLGQTIVAELRQVSQGFKRYCVKAQRWESQINPALPLKHTLRLSKNMSGCWVDHFHLDTVEVKEWQAEILCTLAGVMMTEECHSSFLKNLR